MYEITEPDSGSSEISEIFSCRVRSQMHQQQVCLKSAGIEMMFQRGRQYIIQNQVYLLTSWVMAPRLHFNPRLYVLSLAVTNFS